MLNLKQNPTNLTKQPNMKSVKHHLILNLKNCLFHTL